MRFRSRRSSAGQLFAVTGTSTVSFGIDAAAETRDGLLGFAVQRVDAAGAAHWMDGFKVFASHYPDPQPTMRVSTWDEPVQSFLWDDFTARPGSTYEYRFHAVKGAPWDLHRSAHPTFSLAVRTEPLSTGRHDVFFNRGVASSQAYVRKFGTDPIDELAEGKRAAALRWLARGLDDALVGFIETAEPGETLLGCFYEFSYEPAARALAVAVARGVDVRIILDLKVNEYTDKKGVFHESFPRIQNLETVAAVGFPEDRLIRREARKSAIAHNKFMVRISTSGRPVEVWTGSTNLSLGGVHGQTNVGHRVRDRGTAQAFAAYWDLLSRDPGGRIGDTASAVRAQNAAFKGDVAAGSPVPADLRDLPRGTTPVFSPRPDADVLSSYGALLDSAQRQGCVTLAFGINKVFKDLLSDNSDRDQLVFLLLEKQDAPDPRNADGFVRLTRRNNVYQAWGAYLADPVYQWARETSARALGLNTHVSYVHSKFMLVDPLSLDPIVVSGSANFSDASTTENDENMLIVRGDRRAADIYVTEFNRIFNHYYFRSVVQATAGRRHRADDGSSRFLDETSAWQEKYRPGTFRAKRLALMTGMQGFSRA